MRVDPIYAEHHPKWLRPRMSTYWWLGKWPYVKFILRELSSVFVAWFVIYLLMLVRAVKQGEAAFLAFLAFSCTTPMLLLNVVTFLFVTFHSITWFAVAPQAIVAHVGTKRVPPFLIAWSHYAAWVGISTVIGFILWRGL